MVRKNKLYLIANSAACGKRVVRGGDWDQLNFAHPGPIHARLFGCQRTGDAERRFVAQDQIGHRAQSFDPQGQGDGRKADSEVLQGSREVS